jgi:TIGR03009 family protein
MRRTAGMFLTLIALCIPVLSSLGQAPQTRRPAAGEVAPAAPAQGPMDARIPATDPAVDKLLAAWERKSSQLKTLDVTFNRIDEMKGWADENYQGKAFLQSPNLACLHFQKVKKGENGKAATLVDHERIVATGQEVRQYDYQTKEIFVFSLDRNQRKRALQEGPLPFLFNMKAAEAKQRYFMRITKENQADYMIDIIPLLETDREVFSRAFLQLNKTTFLPDRLLLVATNGKDLQKYTFSAIQPNQEINPIFFQPLKINGWAVRKDPVPGPPVPPQQQQVGGRPQAPLRRN